MWSRPAPTCTHLHARHPGHRDTRLRICRNSGSRCAGHWRFRARHRPSGDLLRVDGKRPHVSPEGDTVTSATGICQEPASHPGSAGAWARPHTQGRGRRGSRQHPGCVPVQLPQSPALRRRTRSNPPGRSTEAKGGRHRQASVRGREGDGPSPAPGGPEGQGVGRDGDSNVRLPGVRILQHRRDVGTPRPETPSILPQNKEGRTHAQRLPVKPQQTKHEIHMAKSLTG